MVKIQTSGLLAVFLSLAVVSTIGVYAQTASIPDWVKNNAKWWADGQIPETDFINAMQYLISKEILQIPITNAVATQQSLADEDRVTSVVVHFKGDIFGGEQTIYSYSEFQHLSSSIRTSGSGITTATSSTPQFYLSGLPSKDKHDVYKLVDEYVNPGKNPSTYDIKVDLLSGDGKTIQTWEYRKCGIVDYVVYLDSDKLTYRFGDKDDSEYREVLLWECSGFSLAVP